MKTGLELIAAERERQFHVEGWTSEHDAEHQHGELARAAACYAPPWHFRECRGGVNNPPTIWPFENEAWKATPSDRKRELAKAGALIAAELDRLEIIAAAGRISENIKTAVETGKYPKPASPWRTDDPPKDGSTIVALGNITQTDQDGAVDVEPFTEAIHWDDSASLWVTTSGLALAGFYVSKVTIHHWLPQPDDENSKFPNPELGENPSPPSDG